MTWPENTIVDIIRQWRMKKRSSIAADISVQDNLSMCIGTLYTKWKQIDLFHGTPFEWLITANIWFAGNI